MQSNLTWEDFKPKVLHSATYLYILARQDNGASRITQLGLEISQVQKVGKNNGAAEAPIKTLTKPGFDFHSTTDYKWPEAQKHMDLTARWDLWFPPSWRLSGFPKVSLVLAQSTNRDWFENQLRSVSETLSHRCSWGLASTRNRGKQHEGKSDHSRMSGVLFTTETLCFLGNITHSTQGISLVIQWLRLCSQCRGPRFDPCSGN